MHGNPQPVLLVHSVPNDWAVVVLRPVGRTRETLDQPVPDWCQRRLTRLGYWTKQHTLADVDVGLHGHTGIKALRQLEAVVPPGVGCLSPAGLAPTVR